MHKNTHKNAFGVKTKYLLAFFVKKN